MKGFARSFKRSFDPFEMIFSFDKIGKFFKPFLDPYTGQTFIFTLCNTGDRDKFLYHFQQFISLGQADRLREKLKILNITVPT
jgi:hypothetical protein